MTPDISVSAAATLSLAKAILDLGILLYSKIPPPPNETDLNNDLKFIKDEFMMMRAYLADAAKAGGYQTEAARTWITQVRNLAYDVEDYFQEFVLHLRTTKKPQKPRNTVVDQICGLKGRIHETNQRYKDYFLSPAFATGEARDPQKLFITMDALLVGRETEKSHIIQLVNKDDKQRQIIPIWGMCGLGKTALAQSICQQRDIISKFKMCAGITLSHPFMVDEVIRSLIYQLGNEEWTYKETLKKMEHEDLIKELNRLLHKEKHLIVLDNVSSIDNWKDLIDLFPEEQCSTASRIIVTTREKSVAEHCSRENMYKLEAMKDDEALELFMNKVPLKAEYFDEQPELMNHAKSIVLKCRGLPLAISAIGGFLATKPRTVQEWGNFNENFYSELDRNPSLKILKTSLTSHCKDLPYHLKLCFLYLSIFCEDQNMIRRKCLIRRWIAEGYLGDMNAEKNGEVYFADFINKSIIQPSPPVDIGGVATIRYCRVHSLLGEISLAQSMEEKFCFVLGSRSSSSQTCDDNVRHLSISSSWRRDANDLKAVGDISHVRSLTVCGKWEPALKLLENMRMLRVLDLAGTGELLWDHHIEPHLDKLIHLKYLSLRGCRNIFWLTHSLGNLRDLETLDVRGTSMIILPKTIVNLEKLQYIRAGQIPKDEQPTDCMGSAEPKTNTRLTLGGVTKGVIKNSFRSEPKDSGEASKRDTFNKTFFCDGHLLNSRRDKHGIEVPKGTGKLSSLETLGVIDVGARKNTSTELVILTKLRKLGVTGLKRENSQQFFSAIAMLTLLQSLSIRSEGKPGLQECLDGKSSSPPTDIRSLKLYGNLITLPPWISSLQNLAKLKLRSTRLGPDAVYVLGRLPCLAILRLLSNSIEGEDLRFNFQHGTFRSLVLLQLDGLPDLQSIEFKQGATPNLELLQVDNCTDIEKHGCSGLSFLPSLKEVWLKAGHRYSKIFMDDLKKQLEGNPNRSILKDN